MNPGTPAAAYQASTTMMRDAAADPARLRAAALEDARMCLRRAQTALQAAATMETSTRRMSALCSAHSAAGDALDAVGMAEQR